MVYLNLYFLNKIKNSIIKEILEKIVLKDWGFIFRVCRNA